MGYDPNAVPRFKRSYGINGTNNVGGTAPSEYAGGNTLADIDDPSGTILVAETTDENAWGRLNDGDDFGNPDVAFKGHLGNSNFLFCDGHVKALKATATGIPTNIWSG